MSFSSNVKTELCKDGLSKKCCALAEACGVLLYANACSLTQIRIITENDAFAARLPKLFRRAFGQKSRGTKSVGSTTHSE